MLHGIWLGLFLPFAGFLLLLAISNRIGRRLAGWIACAAIFIPFLCFCGLLYIYTAASMSPESITLFNWIPVDGIQAGFTLRLDPLSLLMALIVTGVGFLIHVYSVGYMDHEEDFARYFSCLNFFVFAMLLLVLSGHLLLFFVGWEGVGLASYLLIGFWYQRPSAAKAATKAFIVNRIGDLGLLLGLILTFVIFGTGDIAQICHQAAQKFSVGAPLVTLLTLLYFIGATGKSAQLPLHVWLPDAMEGPTPVSALIHAATMVTAGVYLVVRLHPIFLLAPATMNVVAVVGAATALFAALCGLSQTDLKRVLAYSTISQLGLMFLACGVGAFYAAMFHLTTHAFVKALLFLAAGNVVHMMHGATDMEKMGGLRKIFNRTHGLFLIGVLAMSGIPPLAAFFSKDLILEQVHHHGFALLFYTALTTSVLTAFYLMRAYCLTFTGALRLEEKILKEVREAPPVMLTPVTLLAFLSIVGGFLGFALGRAPQFENFLREIGIGLAGVEPSEGFHLTPETWQSLGCALAGLIAAAFLYIGFADKLGPTILFLRKAFFVDEIYNALIVMPLKGISRLIAEILEPKFFDGALRGMAGATQGIGGWLARIQSGQIRSYVAWMAVGAVLLIVYLIF